jgi:hypothetical protein
MPEPGEARILAPRAIAALRQLDAAGKAIGAEMRRRAVA